MSKKIIRLLALTLCMIVFCTTALAANCTNCGNPLDAGDKFCGECGAKVKSAPVSSSNLTIDSCVLNEDGTVTVRWTDKAANGPYDVLYSLVDAAPKPFHWMAKENTSGKSYTTDMLVPGVAYYFYVRDNSGNTSSGFLYQPNMPSFNNVIGASLCVEPRGKIHRTTPEEIYFSSYELARNLTRNEYGLWVNIEYSPLAYPRDYRIQLCIEAPNGFVDTVHNVGYHLPAGRSKIKMDCMRLNEYFNDLLTFYEEIPTGEYNITMYFDGDIIYDDTFYVSN